MVATLAGLGALMLGLALLLLPLLATELSRPGDSAWGALVLVLALVLVTSTDRLTGSPMLAVISGGLLIGRLLVEVGAGRWRQLTPEEQGRLGSWERWRTSFSQVGASLQGVVEASSQQVSAVLAGWQERRQPTSSGKRWVRPEEGASASAAAEGPASAADQPPGAASQTSPSPGVVEVSDFEEIDALLQAAPKEESPEEVTSEEPISGRPAGGAG